ncbi:MAG: pyrroline-5-carboxylate reductase [Candidatus Micrarchaeota archaeon]
MAGRKIYKITILGAGRLGSTLAVSLSKRHRVIVSDPNPERLAMLARQSRNIAAAASNEEAIRESSVIIFAVKPSVIIQTIALLKQLLAGKLVVSCAAGTSLKKIEAATGPARVIRLMPNICAEVGEGMLAYAPGMQATAEDESVFVLLFSPLGRCLKIDEGQLNAITAASGSGPAFLAFFAKSIHEAAVESGLSEETAKIAVAQTLMGTGKLLLSGKTFDDIISTVASPGGTTEAGLKALEAKGVKAAIKEAITDAIKKAKELEEKS